jgi:hypothetical protein
MRKAIDLKIGDVVSYKGNRFPFGDMTVVKKDEQGITCYRPFIDIETFEARFEECWFPLNGSFEFDLQDR